MDTAEQRMGPIAAVAPADERRILYEIIRTISSSVDLEEVLAAIVRLVSEGTKAHGAYVFIVEGDGRLVLRAATGEYRDQIGRANMRRGEGIAGWVAEHRQPVFIPEDALSDPRIKYFPELDEDKYQSLVSVPLIGKAGDAIGVIALHAEAPRVFTAEDASFVIHSAALVASAIENARLYEEARRRVRELERLSTLAEAISSTSTVEELLPIVTAQSLALLRAEQVHVYLVEGGDALRRASSAPVAGDAPPLVRMAELSGDLRRPGRGAESTRGALAGALWGGATVGATLTAPLAADGELLGFLVARSAGGRPFDDDDRDLAASVAAQTAVGIKKILLIEGLAERNLIKDFFQELAAGRSGPAVLSRARRLGCDLAQPKLAVVAMGWRGAEPQPDSTLAHALDRFESAAARALPGVLFDRRDDVTRGLVPVLGADDRESLRRLGTALAEGGQPLPLVVGVSNPCVGPEAISTGLDEAGQAARAAPVITERPAVVPFDGLGPYKYLLRVPMDDRVRDRHREALRRLVDYDRQRQAQLTRTLEEFLRQRGNISATAQSLYVHPNTLRQRLRRIADLTRIDVKRDDWLMIEIALKLLKLEDALRD